LQFVLFAFIAVAGWVGGEAWSGTLATATSLAGLVLLAVGALLAGTGLLALGSELTPMPRPREQAQLVHSGVYAHVRHPIYGGIITLALGWGLVSASPVALLLTAVLAGFFELKSRREEAWLIEHDDGYAGYMLRTRRFFPRLY
jgi:protein-S-isoprenylcysteine O-methyltransferase Ste14